MPDRTTAAAEDFLRLSEACEDFGQLVSYFIVHQHPELAPHRDGIARSCAAETYMAVQEMGELARCEAMQLRGLS